MLWLSKTHICRLHPPLGEGGSRRLVEAEYHCLPPKAIFRLRERYGAPKKETSIRECVCGREARVFRLRRIRPHPAP